VVYSLFNEMYNQYRDKEILIKGSKITLSLGVFLVQVCKSKLH